MRLSFERKKELKCFLKEIKVKFSDLDLLNLALTHKSYVNDSKSVDRNNERLEFLGDSVLGLIVTEYLYNEFENFNEGELARIKSFVVSEDALSKIAKKINLNRYILIGKGEEFSGGRMKKAILADCFEAFLGGLFLDSNTEKVKGFVLKFLSEEIYLVVNDKHEKDYKTLLQEFVQKNYKICPVYTLKNEDGPEHDKIFYMQVFVNDKLIGGGEGKSKKEAEKQAAKNGYLKITSKSMKTAKK